ncbi:MAG: hypothetical protein RTU30_09075 [Candidatus Thorarchaeota archaeon]
MKKRRLILVFAVIALCLMFTTPVDATSGYIDLASGDISIAEGTWDPSSPYDELSADDSDTAVLQETAYGGNQGFVQHFTNWVENKYYDWTHGSWTATEEGGGYTSGFGASDSKIYMKDLFFPAAGILTTPEYDCSDRTKVKITLDLYMNVLPIVGWFSICFRDSSDNWDVMQVFDYSDNGDTAVEIISTDEQYMHDEFQVKFSGILGSFFGQLIELDDFVIRRYYDGSFQTTFDFDKSSYIGTPSAWSIQFRFQITDFSGEHFYVYFWNRMYSQWNVMYTVTSAGSYSLTMATDYEAYYGRLSGGYFYPEDIRFVDCNNLEDLHGQDTIEFDYIRVRYVYY